MSKIESKRHVNVAIVKWSMKNRKTLWGIGENAHFPGMFSRDHLLMINTILNDMVTS